jgi:hypothetical protein
MTLLADLTAKMAVLDPRMVNSMLAACALEVAHDGLRYGSATDFARGLDADLQLYFDEPEVTAEALAELEWRERGTVFLGASPAKTHLLASRFL